MMSLAQAAQVLNGRLVPAAGGASDVTFTAVSTDSRAISAGDLFIALRGDNFDGGKFVAAAARDGAVAALVNADGFQDDAPPCPVLLVDDTRLALGRLAAHWRAQFALLLVALTGSNGKTTVKEMLASILRDAVGDADAVLATQGNFN
ncbi:MAG: Mur ligase domain-containing protein, partial [Gallionellaceae bacterium]|nr:Mur ligase domain-containing protein [Gallionellaceae bacterium]